MSGTNRFHALLSNFPKVRHAFAYGSKVFSQEGVGQDSLLDFIFMVDHPDAWHDQNLFKNPGHYACLGRALGGSTIDGMATRIGAGVYFNTDIELAGQRIKYGVTSTAHALQDLRNWDTFYIAGRLQKPVLHLVKDREVMKAVEHNVAAAAAASLLLLPSAFPQEDFYKTAVSLSYQGDVRMKFAEDINKISKIAGGSARQLHHLYAAPLQRHSTSDVNLHLSQDIWTQDVHPQAREALLRELPPAIASQIRCLVGTAKEETKQQEKLSSPSAQVTSGMVDYTPRLVEVISQLNQRSSKRQAILGILSAGSRRSMAYLYRKMIKSLRSRIHRLN